jgi:hypothetical protein
VAAALYAEHIQSRKKKQFNHIRSLLVSGSGYCNMGKSKLNVVLRSAYQQLHFEFYLRVAPEGKSGHDEAEKWISRSAIYQKLFKEQMFSEIKSWDRDFDFEDLQEAPIDIKNKNQINITKWALVTHRDVQGPGNDVVGRGENPIDENVAIEVGLTDQDGYINQTKDPNVLHVKGSISLEDVNLTKTFAGVEIEDDDSEGIEASHQHSIEHVLNLPHDDPEGLDKAVGKRIARLIGHASHNEAAKALVGLRHAQISHGLLHKVRQSVFESLRQYYKTSKNFKRDDPKLT